MVFVSVTRLRIRSLRYLIPFLWDNQKAKRQVVRAAGFLGGQLLVDKNRTFWTLTLWDSESSMSHYRNNGSHRQAMPKLAGWCSEASTVHWKQETFTLPDWHEVHQRMVLEGREFPVKKRAAEFQIGTIPAPRFRTRLMQTIKPVRN